MIRNLGLLAALAATAIFASDAQAFGRRGGSSCGSGGSSCGSGQVVSYGGGGCNNSGGYSTNFNRGGCSPSGFSSYSGTPSFGGYASMPSGQWQPSSFSSTPSSGQWQPATFGGSTPYTPNLSTPYTPPTIQNVIRIPTQTYGSPITGTPSATTMTATLNDGSTVNLIQTGTDQSGRPMYTIQPTTASPNPAKPIIPPNK